MEGEIQLVVATVDKVAKAVLTLSAPNFGTLTAFAAMILTIIGMVAAPCAWFVVHEMARQDQNLRDMDTKLQREYQLMDQTSAACNTNAAAYYGCTGTIPH